MQGRPTYVDDEARFWAKVNKNGSVPEHDLSLGNCWQWTAAKDKNGYGQFKHGDTMRAAHRISHLLTHGAEPEDKIIDHICRNRSCVRPSHFRLVTVKQNMEHVALNAKNTSGYRGVHFKKQIKKWHVQVGHNYRRYDGGYFDDVHEAGEAARLLRIKLHTHNDLDRKASS